MSDVAALLHAFASSGMAELGPCFDRDRCRHLLDLVRRHRDFGPHLFLSEAEFREDPQLLGISPRAGRNLLESLEGELAFIEGALVFRELLDHLLGRGWEILRKKLVCAVPESWLAPWLLEHVQGYGIPNLGSFVRPEYRDLTYFHGLGCREIAEIVACPVDTVKTRMFHARRRLRMLLTGTLEDWL